MNVWYKSLECPPLTPPDWVFGPVWTVLYGMIVVAVFRFLRGVPRDRRGRAWAMVVVHLVSNALWTPLFFGCQQPAWALMDIVLMNGTLWVLLRWARRVDRWSVRLLLPYAAWIAFATYLNAGFVWLN